MLMNFGRGNGTYVGKDLIFRLQENRQSETFWSNWTEHEMMWVSWAPCKHERDWKRSNNHGKFEQNRWKYLKKTYFYRFKNFHVNNSFIFAFWFFNVEQGQECRNQSECRSPSYRTRGVHIKVIISLWGISCVLDTKISITIRCYRYKRTDENGSSMLIKTKVKPCD